MRKLMLALCAVLLAVSQSAQAGLIFAVQSYTASSLTFSVSGQMPGTDPGVMGGPWRISLRYTGNLWAGGASSAFGSLSADPFVGAGGVDLVGSGGFPGTAENYTYIEFQNELAGLSGTGAPVTVALGAPFLNTSGSGNVELYWGSIVWGVDQNQVDNVPFGPVQVVDGRIVGAAEVPEPAGAALFGLGLLALGALRRRSTP